MSAICSISKKTAAIALFVLMLSGIHVYGQVQIAPPTDSLEYRSNIKGPLEFRGFAKELSKKLKGAIVTLYESPDGSHEGLTEIFRTATPGSGQFDFKLEINKMYVLSVEQSGYTTKKVDFDTDVTMARSQHTSVPRFEFEVDMVKDLDGLAFVGSVASVFYHIGSNTFNYQLDYSKEEMEDEERELREKLEKARLAKLAYEKKKAIELAAQILRDKENATAQQIIEAAITVGDGNKDATVKGFLDVFPEVDSLRNKKGLVMFDQYLEERKKIEATGGKINFQAIFDSAKAFEDAVVKDAENEREKRVSVLRNEKEEAARKEKEAMVLQQKALELEAQEKLARANAEAEARKKKEEQEKRDKIYYAIFDSNGDSETAIQNLIKTYPRADQYKEEKARAIYAEYEKTRLTGTTLSQMDFNKLFDAADIAEQAAIKKELEDDNAKQNSRMEEFMKKVEERKKQERDEAAAKIKKGLTEASADKASQLAVFEDALPKNESYKEEKAAAMYDQYVQQKKAIADIEQALKSAPSDRKSQLAVFYNALPENTPDREGTAQRMYDEYTASKQAQGGSGSINLDFGSLFMAAEQAGEAAQLEAKEKTALEKRLAQEQLEARRDAIRDEKRDLAAQAEKQVSEVHRAEMANAKSKREMELANAIEKGGGDRDASVEAIMKALQTTDDKELDRAKAEAVYDTYLNESRSIKESGNLGTKVNFSTLFDAADKAELAHLERQYQQKQAVEDERLALYEERRTEKAIEIAKAKQTQAEKEVESAELAYENTLHKTEVMRQERLAEEQQREEETARKAAMEQAKREVLEKERAVGELDIVERQRIERLEAEEKRLAEIAAATAEQKRRDQELADKQAAKDLALLEEAKRKEREAETKRLEAEEKRLAELAAAEAEQKRKEQELADKQAAKDLALLEETKRKELEAENKRLAAEEDERKRLALEAKKAEEEQRKLEIAQQEELAKAKAAEEQQNRLANYEKLVSAGDQAIKNSDYKTAWKNYDDALALYPDNKDVATKLKDANTEIQRLEKEAAEQLALDTRYNTLMQEAEQELAENNFDAAKSKFGKAAELKPNERVPNQKIKNIDDTLAKLELDRKQRQDDERKYILLMQDGAKAMEANQLDQALAIYEEALSMKPDEMEPQNRLQQIAAAQEQIAQAAQAENARKVQAQKEFEKQQEEERKRKEIEDARKQEALAARIKAQAEIDDSKANVKKTAEELEDERIAKYEQLQLTLRELDLNPDEQRQAFLSELAKIYPQGLTQETVEGKNFVLLRHVINENNVVTIYEKKTWDWGGIFYFKNADIAITEGIYKLEIGKY